MPTSEFGVSFLHQRRHLVSLCPGGSVWIRKELCACVRHLTMAITSSSHISSLLQYLILSSPEVLAGPGGKQASFIALGGSESFFRSYKSSFRLLKYIILKAVWETTLIGGDTKMSGASFTALGSSFCFCWNYLSGSLPSCWAATWLWWKPHLGWDSLVVLPFFNSWALHAQLCQWGSAMGVAGWVGILYSGGTNSCVHQVSVALKTRGEKAARFKGRCVVQIQGGSI